MLFIRKSDIICVQKFIFPISVELSSNISVNNSKGCGTMDIAGLSMAMAQNNIGTKVGVAVLDKAMETAETTGSQIVQMIDSAAMQRSVNPHIGGNIDISV